jgi:hypothetical protein
MSKCALALLFSLLILWNSSLIEAKVTTNTEVLTQYTFSPNGRIKSFVK